MANKKNKTFASRAKQLIKSYPRADWDSIEKAALESSLEKLQQEQEIYKQTNQIGEYSPQEMANGGNINHDGETPGSTSYLPLDDFYTQDYGYTPETTVPTYAPAAKGFRVVGAPGYTPPVEKVVRPEGIAPKSTTVPTRAKAQRENIYLPDTPMQRKSGVIERSDKLQSDLDAMEKDFAPYNDAFMSDSLMENPIKKPITNNNDEGTYSPYKTSIAPSLISGATSALGNMYLASKQKGNDNIKLPRISTPTISLERGRQSATREATKANQRIKHASKGAARTRGEYAANRMAGEAQVSGKLGETLSASHEKEALINANMKLGMSKYNAAMKAKETMINQAQKIKNKEEREAYLAAAIGSVGKVSKDINSLRQHDAYANMMGEDYGMYMYDDPNSKWYQPKRKVKAHRNADGTIKKRQQ